MKKIGAVLILLVFFVGQSCSNGKRYFDPTGKWVAENTIFELDINCEKCSEEELLEMKAIMKEGVDKEMKIMERKTFITFNSDDTFVANINGRKMKGTFSVEENGALLKLKIGNEAYGTTFRVKKDKEGAIELIYDLPGNELKEMSETENVLDVGELKFIVSKMLFSFVRQGEVDRVLETEK